MRIPPRGSFSDNTLLWKGSSPNPAPDILPEVDAGACGKLLGTTCHRGTQSTAHHGTVPRWHEHATVASDATVARYAEVKGELRVPNTINFSLFPTLDPFAKAVYYQLFLLSHGFKRDRCLVGLAKLATAVLMSLRKVQDTIAYLEKRGLIKRLGSALGGTSKGNIYQVMLPAAGMAPVPPWQRVPPWQEMLPWHHVPPWHQKPPWHDMPPIKK